IRVPSPWQTVHFLEGIVPRPWQFEHSRRVVNDPKKDFLVSCTFPAPAQCSHFLVSVPGSAPLPEHLSQKEFLFRRTVLFRPKTESSKDISKSMNISRPLLPCFLVCCPPPKKPSKISPKSKFDCPLFCPPNWLKSKPEKSKPLFPLDWAPFWPSENTRP